MSNDMEEIVSQLNRLRIVVDQMEDQLVAALNKIQDFLEEGENSEALEFVKTLLVQVEEESE